jgi:hypothetical protein
MTADIADAPTAEGPWAATAPTLTWAKDVKGLNAIQSAPSRDENLFTSLE